MTSLHPPPRMGFVRERGSQRQKGKDMETMAERIQEVASLLASLLDEQVPERPTFWNGVPESYDFPMDATDYEWLRSGLSKLVEALETEEV